MEKLYGDKIHCLTSKSRSDEGDIGFSSERGIHESGNKFFLSSIYVNEKRFSEKAIYSE